MRSHAGVRTDLFHRDPSKVLLTDFFGGVSQADVVTPEEFLDSKAFANTVPQSQPASTIVKETASQAIPSALPTTLPASWQLDSSLRSWGALGFLATCLAVTWSFS